MEIGVVTSPDPEWKPRLTQFLEHKGPDWLPQIEGALMGPLDHLQTRFYVGLIDRRIACHTMISGDRGIGILSHVFTRPEDRRKGAIDRIFDVLIADCTAAFHCLTLGTEYNSPAYHIYQKHGFRSVSLGLGEMWWGEMGDVYAPEATEVRPVRWDDWGFFNLLALQPVSAGEDLPRGPLLGLKAQGSVEGTFLGLQARRLADDRLQAWAFVSHSGATVGWALLGPDTRWFGDAWQLDLHVHPQFEAHLPKFLEAISWPDAPVVSFLTNPNGPKAMALHHRGFRDSGRLPAWIEYHGRHDVLAMTL
jgi:hypothetical protein